MSVLDLTKVFQTSPIKYDSAKVVSVLDKMIGQLLIEFLKLIKTSTTPLIRHKLFLILTISVIK